ncbi:MAG: heme o synthase [Armatimonadota bacterium]|nr:heme o synthase [Armatimonadota bacterium]MDR7451595.1 heme o synthase [Armatimonadota bacterium]MDR7467685.1 heme o synthase [Armatimonadota bacterium]MDR7492564.1 heme o synthase [Armatimonadota bacterium]MDR7499968.1 heme o synthase [Armatimonadota bacterium]
MKRFATLATVTTLATYVLVVVGGLVRAAGAGLACPDWPLCHGRLIPPLQGPVIIEYIHRLVASLVGVLTLALAVAAWRRRWQRGPALAALLLVGVQILLGGLTVQSQLYRWLVLAHLGTAMVFLATLVALTTFAWLPEAPVRRSAFRVQALVTVLATFGLVLIGGYVTASAAGIACPDWPLCYGRIWPGGAGATAVQMTHRLAAAVVGALIVLTAASAYRTEPGRADLQATSAIAVGLLVLQVLLGAMSVEYRLAAGATTAHLATAAALFATLVVLAALSSREVPPRREAAAGVGPSPTGRPLSHRILSYVALTKPRILVLLLVTALASMLIAAPGRVSPWVILFTMLGGAASAGAANAINQVLERDIDAVMSRTRRRPIPSGQVGTPYALAFAILLGAAAFVELAVLVNLVSAFLALLALGIYVVVYTLWLKRSTPQNIVIGGAAGAMPPLVGWAAATGRIDLPAVLLFLIVFLWTPPHFWALALHRREDYARAGVPMLPVVAGEETTRRQIVFYTVLLVAATLLLQPFGAMGWVYGASALLLGAVFVALAVQLWRERSRRSAVRLFGYSVVYLALLFAAMVADRLIG